MVSIGIDLGTTSIKVCFVKEKEIELEKTLRHGANLPDRLGVQDAKKIIKTAVELLKESLTEYRQSSSTIPAIKRLRIAGQMHGVVLWSGEKLLRSEFDCSPLFTWMYPNKQKSSLPPSSRPSFPGFGGLTLLELEEYCDWNRCGTIMDLLACYLCQLDAVKMSWQLAESFGYCSQGKWDQCLQATLEGKVDLPQIFDDDQLVLGGLEVINELRGVEVLIPLGDLQASIKSVADDGLDAAYIILGTSSQLCVISSLETEVNHPTVDKLPYSVDKCILAGRSMNGGNAIDAFLKMVTSWTNNAHEFDVENLLKTVDSEPSTSVKVVPTFIKERGQPQSGGIISGLDHNTSICQILSGICIGVVDNLTTLFPLKFLQELGIRKLYMVGNSKKNRFSRRIHQLCETVGIEALEAQNDTSAAYGAAIF